MSENNELEKALWPPDKLRSNMDASEYKHIVLGLIFLKYISDAFNDLYEQLKASEGEFEGADPEDADDYLPHNSFFVPEKARWQYLQDRAKQPEIGKWLDEAGFCKAATLEEVRKNKYALMPGRYVGTEVKEDDGIPFDEKVNALTARLAEQLARGCELEKFIRENLKGIGYEF